MDQVIIKDLLVRGVIGITERERAQAQDILINITMFTDIGKAGRSDHIQDCINYSTVAKKTIAYVERIGRYTVEALATDIARLCLEEKGVQGVRVRVEKPGAVRFAQSVGVEIERHNSPDRPVTHQAYIILGSNIQPRENILKAIQRLREVCTINAVSTVWETEAIGTNGPKFLNAAIWLSTLQDAEQLKWETLRPIEEEMGRIRTADKYAPRTIDMDIIIFDEQILEPALWERDYLAIPIAELRPDITEPETERKLNQAAQTLKSRSSAIPKTDIDTSTTRN